MRAMGTRSAAAAAAWAAGLAAILPLMMLAPAAEASPDAKSLYDDLLSNYNRCGPP